MHDTGTHWRVAWAVGADPIEALKNECMVASISKQTGLWVFNTRGKEDTSVKRVVGGKRVAIRTQRDAGKVFSEIEAAVVLAFDQHCLNVGAVQPQKQVA